MEDLQSIDGHDEAWIETARQLSHKVHHHLREEEKKFFQVSGKILSDAQKVSLAAQYRKDYARMHRSFAAS